MAKTMPAVGPAFATLLVFVVVMADFGSPEKCTSARGKSHLISSDCVPEKTGK